MVTGHGDFIPTVYKYMADLGAIFFAERITKIYL